MTGSCSWWLLLVTLLTLISVGPVYCQHIEDYGRTFLLSIKNNESGLEIFTLFPGSVNNNEASQWPDHELKPQILFIPGHNLSSVCGDQTYFRCQHLLVINESLLMDRTGRQSLNTVFVPLEDGVLLLTYLYASSNIMSVEWSIFIVNSFNCSPTVFYNINNKIYMVCISSYEEYVAVYELRLGNYLSDSMIEIEGVTLIEQLTSISNSISDSIISSNFSNFIIVDHMIFFAIGNTIIVLDIFDTKLTQQYPELPQCTQIHKLVLIAGAGNQQVLLAYCTDRYAYFDPVYGDWTTQFSSSSGLPYLCPDNNYRATFFINGILRFSLSGSLLNIINNVNISSGICFESQNRTYFAYSDQQGKSVFVHDFITGNRYFISSYDCTYQDCPQLLLLENQYLVIRDANHNLVLDTTTNFSLIINISGDIADILVILHSIIITPSPPISLNTTTPNAPTLQRTSTPNYTNAITLSPSVTAHSSITVTTVSPGTKLSFNL